MGRCSDERTSSTRAAEGVLTERPEGVRRLIVRGAPGIGKSRFARAVAEQAAARGWRVIAGGFAGLGEPVPYEGWHPVLAAALSGDASGLEAALTARVPDAAGLAPLLAPLLGLTLGDTERSAAFEGENRHEVAADLAVRVLESAARESPLRDRAGRLAMGRRLVGTSAPGLVASQPRIRDHARADPARTVGRRHGGGTTR